MPNLHLTGQKSKPTSATSSPTNSSSPTHPSPGKKRVNTTMSHHFPFLNDEHEAAHYDCLQAIEEVDFQQIAIDALQDEDFRDGAWAFVSENDLNDAIDAHIRHLQGEFIAPGGPAHQSWARVRNATNPDHLQGIEDNNLDLDTFEEIYATIQERLREEVINELTQEF